MNKPEGPYFKSPKNPKQEPLSSDDIGGTDPDLAALYHNQYLPG